MTDSLADEDDFDHYFNACVRQRRTIQRLEAENARLKEKLQTCRNTALLNLRVAKDRGAEKARLVALVVEADEMLHMDYVIDRSGQLEAWFEKARRALEGRGE